MKESVFIASRTYRFCRRSKKISVLKTWSSGLNQLDKCYNSIVITVNTSTYYKARFIINPNLLSVIVNVILSVILDLKCCFRLNLLIFKCYIMPLLQLTLLWQTSIWYRNSPLICSLNQWTGFYVIGTSGMKELSYLCWLIHFNG